MYDLLNQYGPIDADIVRLDIAGMRSVDWSAFARLDSIPQVARVNQSLIGRILRVHPCVRISVRLAARYQFANVILP